MAARFVKQGTISRRLVPNRRVHRAAVLARREHISRPHRRADQASGATSDQVRLIDAASSARWCSELVRCSGPNGGNWMYSRMDCGTADQS